MHHSILIHEIVANICSELNPFNPHEGAALAALATTSRAFLEPALNQLWRIANLCDAINFLNLLPQGCWEIKDGRAVCISLIIPSSPSLPFSIV
jgi:hypothetical protein